MPCLPVRPPRSQAYRSTDSHNARVQRRKCRVKTLGSTCVRCQDWRIDCSLNSILVSRPAQNNPQAQLQVIQPHWANDAASPENLIATKSQEIQPSSIPCAIDLRRELVRHYFRVIHDTHHSIFHRPSVEQDLEDGKLPDVLLYAMMALAARYAACIAGCGSHADDARFSDSASVSHEDRRTRGQAFASRAMKLLDLTSISLTTIQACILLGTICFSESNAEAEAIYYAVANRLAQIMDLPNRHTENAVQRQVHLRGEYCRLVRVKSQ